MTSNARISQAFAPMMSTGFDLQSVTELRSKPQLCASRSVFTADELAYCTSRRDPVQSLAGLISTKEAFVKAVGAFDDVPNFTFTDLQVHRNSTGRPQLLLRGDLGAWSEKQGLAVAVSISHSGDLAGAVVVLLA